MATSGDFHVAIDTRFGDYAVFNLCSSPGTSPVVGYLPMDADSGHWIFQVISRRYECGSIVLTSNRGFADWGSVFADQVVATAILDRLLHHATVINIKGGSYRMRAHVPAGSGRGAAMLG